MATRYYEVVAEVGADKHKFLVDATSAQGAISFIAKKFVRAKVATPSEIIQFMQDGGKPEKAKADVD